MTGMVRTVFLRIVMVVMMLMGEEDKGVVGNRSCVFTIMSCLMVIEGGYGVGEGLGGLKNRRRKIEGRNEEYGIRKRRMK